MSDTQHDQDRRVTAAFGGLYRRGTYGLLALGCVLSVLSAPLFGRDQTISWLLVGTAFLAVWHWWFVDRTWSRQLSAREGATYLTVRTAVMVGLTVVNPFFAVAAWLGYHDAPLYVGRRPTWLVYVLTALALGGAQSGGLPPQSVLQTAAFVGLFGFNLTVFAFVARATEREEALSAERVQTIGALEETNQRLAAALEENAELQEQLVAQAREAGVHDERQRLALEIHDTIAQSLAGIVTQLNAADETVEPSRAQAHRELARDLAREALNEARRSVEGLSPHRLDDCDLGSALQQVVADWSHRTGVEADLVVDGTAEPLHRDVETTILRIAQEALTNVDKHAGARRALVTLAYMGDVVTLDVRDDGAGFAPERVNGRGVGLHGMRQRAARVAGRVVVESEPGAGTAVSLLVPAVTDD